MKSASSILVVEDEAAIRTGLVDVLVYHGYQVEYAEEGLTGLEKALSGKFDLILLDVMLPNMDGFEICSKIRAKDKYQPIIMLTAKSTDEDVITGLTLGADDYVAKPFSVAQLILRVKAVLRRTSPVSAQDHFIQLDRDRKVDLQNLCINIGKQTLPFTKREIEVLEYLQVNNERPVSREELLEQVWGYKVDMEIETRTVDIHIARIRRKIEEDPKRPTYLMTVRGAGYRLHSANAA
jgi:DNA-binding response OmpR family regulator